jgi:hypothetical protein
MDKRKRGPAGDTSPTKWGSRISGVRMNSLGPIDSQPTKKLKGEKQLDSPDIFPSRFTSRNFSTWGDDTPKGPDVLRGIALPKT